MFKVHFMKKFSSFFFVLILFSACSVSGTKFLSTEKYATSRDEGHEGNSKILKGIINRKLLENDTAFKWLADNYKYANPDAKAIEAFKNKKDKFSIIVFGGTWCHDTQNLLPMFYKLVDKSGFDASKVFLIGVNRAKTTIKKLEVKYAIKNVPTFIVIDKLGIEIGRIVEYGKTGYIDKELGEIVSKIPQ